MDTHPTQPTARGRGGLSAGEWAVLVVALAVTVCGGALRLVGIDEIGLKGSDNTYYTNIARLWSEGDRAYSIGDSPELYHRPVAFWVYGRAIRLFGFNDASIKTVNASLDTFNILLVFLLAWILSRRDPWVASSTAIIYALLPFPVLVARGELTHTLSTSTLLVAFNLLCLSWFAQRPAARLILVLLSGAATGLSALTHEEMIFSAAAPALFLALTHPRAREGVWPRLVAAAVHAGSYLFGVLLVAHGMLQTHQADAQGRASEIIAHRISHADYARFVERPLKFSWNAVTGTSSTILACLVIAAILVLLVRLLVRLKKGRIGWSLPDLPIEDLPLWTVAAHLLLYSFFLTYYAVRLFLPLIPLVIVWLIVRTASLTSQCAGRRVSRVIVAVLTVALVIANLGHITTFRDSLASRCETWTRFSVTADVRPTAGWSAFRETLTRVSWARKRFEELGQVVTDHSRLMVGASTFHPFPGRRLLQIGYYFGDNAVYLIDHDQPLDQLIEEKEIGFVLYTAYQAEDRQLNEWGEMRRYLYQGRWSPRQPLSLGKSLGLADGEYAIPVEFERLRALMARRGARIILGRRDLLTKRPSWDDPVSYVVWALDAKSWPPLAEEVRVTSRSLELASRGRVTEALAVLDAAGSKSRDWSAVRLRLTRARILAEHDRPSKARQQVAKALALVPRNTTVAVLLRDAFPTRPATEEMYGLFAGLQETAPEDRNLRDLVLCLALNLAELTVESRDRAAAIDAFETIGRRLESPGSGRLARDIADWCAATSRDLVRDGRPAEAEAAGAAASAAHRKVGERDR